MLHIPGFFIEIERRSIENMLQLYVRSEKKRFEKLKMLPENFEWCFGVLKDSHGDDSSVETPLKMSRENPPLLLKGKVDRIDYNINDRSLFRIIDYKSGSIIPSLGDIERGISFQLPVYIEAVKKLLKPEGIVHDGIFISIRNGKVGGSGGKHGKQWDEYIEVAEKKMREWLSNIKRGNFNFSLISRIDIR